MRCKWGASLADTRTGIMFTHFLVNFNPKLVLFELHVTVFILELHASAQSYRIS